MKIICTNFAIRKYATQMCVGNSAYEHCVNYLCTWRNLFCLYDEHIENIF